MCFDGVFYAQGKKPSLLDLGKTLMVYNKNGLNGVCL